MMEDPCGPVASKTITNGTIGTRWYQWYPVKISIKHSSGVMILDLCISIEHLAVSKLCSNTYHEDAKTVNILPILGLRIKQHQS